MNPAKLRRPAVRPQAVERERLTRSLIAATREPVTVVHAAAGYGKSAALAQFAAAVEVPVAWLTLDAGDDDPRRLIAHLQAAVTAATGEPPIGLPSADAARLVRAIAGPLVIVLDDYQTLAAEAARALVAALLDALPSTVRVVIATRTSLSLPRSAELHVDELRFRDAEVEALLNRGFGLGLSADELAAVQAHADGWPVALALIAEAIRELGLERAHVRWQRDVDRYLEEEVLDELPDDLRAFLRRTAILDRLEPPIAALLAGDADAAERIAELRRQRLFVDAGGRYQPLFAERLRRELAPGEAEALHVRAARWYERAGERERAFRHACAAGDGRLASELLQSLYARVLDERGAAGLRALLVELPPDRGVFSGFSDALGVLCELHEGLDPALALERVLPLAEERGVAPILDRIRVTPFTGRVADALGVGRAAWDRDPEARPWLVGRLAALLWFSGDGAGARALTERHLRDLGADSRAWALAALALIALDDADLDAAERFAREAVAELETAERGAREAINGWDGPLESDAGAFVHGALAAVLTATGRLDEAGTLVGELRRATDARPGSFAHLLALILDAELHLARDERAAAVDVAARARGVALRYPDIGVLGDRLQRIAALLSRRRGKILLGTPPTPAELRVLVELAGDRTMRQIAERLFLTTDTVQSHSNRLYRRLGVNNREDAVRVARDRGLL